MNRNRMEGKWKQLAGSARERWGKLTGSRRQTIGGKKDQLIGRIQELYGIAKAEAEERAADRSPTSEQSARDTNLALRL
jgi:uncharacterized protein YjbJ (UPF0337 family)